MTPDVTDFDLLLLEAHNRIRTDPHSYLPMLEEMILCFTSEEVPNLYTDPVTGREQLTHEGPKAINSLIEYIKRMPPVGSPTSLRPYSWESKMQEAAMDHVRDHGWQGKVGHKSTNGSKPFERLQRYGGVPGLSGENIAYGNFDPKSREIYDVDKIVLQFAIDDGIKSRGHRINIFSDKFLKFASFMGRHSKHKKMCVCVYAEIFQPIIPRGPLICEIEENEKKYGQTIDKDELEAWMGEALDWSDVQPDDAVSWKQKQKQEVDGLKAIKTIKRKYKLKTGKYVEVEKRIEKEFYHAPVVEDKIDFVNEMEFPDMMAVVDPNTYMYYFLDEMNCFGKNIVHGDIAFAVIDMIF